MNNRNLGLAVVVVLAVFVGVTLTVKKTNDPVMRRLIAQQNQILNSQKAMQGALTRIEQEQQNPQPVPQPVARAVATQQPGQDAGLTQRVELLEAKLDALTNMIKNVSQNAQRQQRPAPPPEDLNKVYEIPVAHSPVKGSKKAPVTIVEFADIQCPYCARFHPVIEEVLAAYPKKVNYVMKNFPLPFHQQAKAAAKAAFAAGEQGKYFEMLDQLLANAKQLTPEKYEELAKNIGINVKRFKKDLEANDAKYEAWIQADMALATKVAVRGTPTFFLNGKKTRARDLNMYKQEIDAILK